MTAKTVQVDIDSIQALAGYQTIECGALHPDPDVSRPSLRPTTFPGCGRLLSWIFAYRCVDCGLFFHHACILKHFQSSAEAPLLMTTDLAAAARRSEVERTAAEEANRRFFIWRSQNGPQGKSDMEVELHEAYGAGFAAGARWSFVESSRLAPAMATLADFVDFLRSAGTSPQVDLEEVRAAWRAVKHVIYSGVSSDLVDEFDAMDILLGLHSEA